jgi:hypothetical protein
MRMMAGTLAILRRKTLNLMHRSSVASLFQHRSFFKLTNERHTYDRSRSMIKHILLGLNIIYREATPQRQADNRTGSMVGVCIYYDYYRRAASSSVIVRPHRPTAWRPPATTSMHGVRSSQASCVPPAQPASRQIRPPAAALALSSCCGRSA